MTRFLTLCLLCCGLFTVLTAQAQYTVEVGAFQDADQGDFAEIKPLGFVYGSKIGDNVHQVYLGTFEDLNKAETLSMQLRARGFRNARVLQRPPGRSVAVIQMATKLLSSPIDWVDMGKVGNIFVENVDDKLKVMTGAYADVAAAQAALPSVRSMGYKDAFVKTIDFNRLIPIGAFETGVKEPLIPIQLNPQQQPVNNNPATYDNTGVQQPQAGVVYPGNSAPNTYNGVPTTPPSTGNVVAPGTTLPAANLPNIRGRFKRESATRLQTVLKEKGFYTGQVDGYYGGGTQAAYDQAFAGQHDLKKYRALVPLLEVPAGDAVMRWPSSSVLLAVSKDMAGGLTDNQLAAQSYAARQQLYSARQPLSASATARANSWSETLWANLGNWAAEDPVHAHMHSAFRLAYYQTQVLLEDHYMDKGFNADAAKDLALATLQNMVGADLERFLY
ncbi:hypothetical protein CEQ90_16860 [Lewinellaceae bacterium SD302]|nr:hypothetical protein CEQ90_16860 [Lewinellaceae bacterium SD302]